MIRILCYGDSNTHGTPPMAHLDDDERFGPEARWPCVMAANLGPGFEVIEEGLPGRTTVHSDPIEGAHLNGLAVLPAILRSHKPLDLVIIKLGTNDLKQRFSLTGFDIGAGGRNLVDCVRQFLPDTQVLLVCPPPPVETGCLAEMYAGAEETARSMPKWFAHFAHETGAAFFDAGKVISVDPLDGIHYDAETQVVLGMELAGAVRSALAK